MPRRTGYCPSESSDSTAVVESVTEDVTVPAGTFHGCARVVETFAYPTGTIPAQPYETQYQRWFAASDR